MLFKIWKETKNPNQHQIKGIVVSEFDFPNDKNHPSLSKWESKPSRVVAAMKKDGE